ncbi:QsdR family transcriptional regulator [Actinoplanes flavus]|uniref:QsdR TetR regulatory C-terminal domain-containing protein n=1 Tax=Actinoplanes flavus TaxID=2820290 RepID=A0ABS3UKP1_9ACTN|nr:QsdR family transcriptional regulator [Actinoplanes flavus]MBO3739359.1 hypothetical protein [Actinoplanes flavus]
MDMDLLATELAISRATLYRAAGSRDTLLGEVFWAIGRILIEEASGEVTATGPDRVIGISRQFAELIDSAQQLRAFIAAEPRTAARVLFTTAADMNSRAVDAQLAIFVESGIEGEPGDLRRRALHVRAHPRVGAVRPAAGQRADRLRVGRAGSAGAAHTVKSSQVLRYSLTAVPAPGPGQTNCR